MDRDELLSEMLEMAYHNLRCYSEKSVEEKAKPEYQEQWHREKAKIEIIEELIREEKESNFKLYTTIYDMKNYREKRELTELAYLENRQYGISCYLMLVDKAENFNEKKLEYELTFSVHKKSNFDEEYENVYTSKLELTSFNNRETLQKEMQIQLTQFRKYIEFDKVNRRFYKEFYEVEEEME